MKGEPWAFETKLDEWLTREPEEAEDCADCGRAIDPARGGLCRDCASLRAAELRGEQV